MIIDRWFNYYRLSNKITFNEKEYNDLNSKYPKINKLYELEFISLPAIEQRIAEASANLTSNYSQEMMVSISISTDLNEMTEMRKLYNQLYSKESIPIQEYIRYELSNDLMNLSRTISDGIKQLEEFNITSIQKKLVDLENTKIIMLSDIDKIECEYSIGKGRNTWD